MRYLFERVVILFADTTKQHTQLLSLVYRPWKSKKWVRVRGRGRVYIKYTRSIDRVFDEIMTVWEKQVVINNHAINHTSYISNPQKYQKQIIIISPR